MIPRGSGAPQPAPRPAALAVGLPSLEEGAGLWLQPRPSARFSTEPAGGRVQPDAATLTCHWDSTDKDRVPRPQHQQDLPQPEGHLRTPTLEGAWGERSRAAAPGPRPHHLLPEQCHVTGFSLFITVFIVLHAAGLVLEGDPGEEEREHLVGCRAALGVLGWGSAPIPTGASQCVRHPALGIPWGAGHRELQEMSVAETQPKVNLY